MILLAMDGQSGLYHIFLATYNMTHLQTLFGSIESVQCRDHKGQFSEIKREPTACVKIHLERGLSITVRECWKLYGSSELRVYIARLRKSGMKINDRWHTFEGMRYKVYSLAKEKK